MPIHEELDIVRNLTLFRDSDNTIRGISHRLKPFVTNAATNQLAAQAYLQQHLTDFQINAVQLANMSLPPETDPIDADVEYRIVDEKPSPTLTTVGYEQTYFGLPVWQAGLTVHIGSNSKVLSSEFTGHLDIHAEKPSEEKLKQFKDLSPTECRQIMTRRGKKDKDDIASPVINSVRFIVYQYDAEQARPTIHDEKDSTNQGVFAHVHPTLPVPPVARGIQDGQHYVVAEILFTLETPQWGLLNWRIFVDVETSSILYLRALVDNVDGMVYEVDPGTQGSAVQTNDTNALLNPLRTTVTLPGLNAPVGGTQSLTGAWVDVSDHETPVITVPTQPTGSDFNYNVRTNDFAAVNCYYHCDRFFRLVDDLGFNMASYFDGTTFPVQIDHRGRFGSTDGIEINASCGGNAMSNGIGLPDFELLDLSDLGNPLGIACHWRVVLHELGGHGILWDHVGSANFGFAHSAGDSFAAILNDPGTAAVDRFVTYPFSPISRRHDRAVAAGWAWGGSNDAGGYSSEQILCTTNFRIYQSIGGDSSRIATQQFAARYMAYLMLQAVSTLTPATNPSNASGFANAMLTADTVDWISEGHAGGAYGKVIRWAFEKQGLYQPAGAPTPVTSEGASPPVDVYIDDGRGGEYEYLPNHWSCQNIWNRLASDGGTAHQPPVVGVTNYAYVKVKNRGTQNATNVIVKGYHCQPSSGLVWPNDWQPMATTQLSAADVGPNDSAEVVVGPFEWVPSQIDHECMLMIVSATGDASNIDNFGVGDSIPEWRLVPHDNNIGQRNVSPVPGGGGLQGLISAFSPRRFTVRNPHGRKARFELVANLPAFLVQLGWEVEYANPGAGSFSLEAGQTQEIALRLRPGGDFSRDIVIASVDRDITISTYADDILIGGMSYAIDPDLKKLPPQRPTGKDGCPPCIEQAEKLLECLDMPKERVKSVRVRKITVDIEIVDDDCCS